MEVLGLGFFQDIVVTAILTSIVFFVLPRLLAQITGNDSSATREDAAAASVAEKPGFLDHLQKQAPEKALGVSDFRLVPSCDNLTDKELKGLKGIEKKSEVFNELLVAGEEFEGDKGGVGGGAEPESVEELGEIQEEKGSPAGDLIQQDLMAPEFEVNETTGDECLTGNFGDDHAVEEEGLGDWEGIERSELEKRFDAAMAFVESKSNADGMDSSLRMQLYALQRAAIEGPCHEPQPMALKVFARAKWNAWQKLGNMSGEVAMEQYMTLLSENIPKWEELDDES